MGGIHSGGRGSCRAENLQSDVDLANPAPQERRPPTLITSRPAVARL